MKATLKDPDPTDEISSPAEMFDDQRVNKFNLSNERPESCIAASISSSDMEAPAGLFEAIRTSSGGCDVERVKDASTVWPKFR